jgi:flagellar basal body-associated protein FliL
MRMIMIVVVSLMVIMAMVCIAVVMLVAVVPELCLIEQKEKQQTEQQGHEQVVGFYTCVKGLRQQVQKSCG